MKSSMPKQFLPILGQSIFLRSLDIFRQMTDTIKSIIVVLDESYRSDYDDIIKLEKNRIIWADPGTERQDSVYNGLLQVPKDCEIVAVHDVARPLVTHEEVQQVISDAFEHGAAVLGVPMKATVKESEDGNFVLRTIPRSRLWEVHTPQVAKKNLLFEGFEKVKKENLEVTDDVSVIEALGLPVRLTLGQYTNIKITTPDDIQVAESILMARGETTPLISQSSETNQEQSHQCAADKYMKYLEGIK
jgi:2-C-methyl-D-erythritol 4-phosphate cytidylyltransferase